MPATRLLLLLLLLVLVACDEHPGRKEHVIDAATFRKTLQCGAPTAANDQTCEPYRDKVRNLESVRIEPRENNSARYEILLKDRAVHDVVFAEFPGKLTDELTAAGIPYSVN